MNRFSIDSIMDADERTELELPEEDDLEREQTDDEEDAADILQQDRERERVRGLNFRTNLQWTFDTTSEIDYGFEDN